jgi:GTP-binding protein
MAQKFSTAATADDTDHDTTPTYSIRRRSGVRNVAIVAHVDHGKTTLVDKLLEAANADAGSEQSERLLDSGDLEIERGITITSKVTRLDYDANVINVVDTPGHSDFAGEVDRILSMVDGVCLVVDAAEGPMAQTKYVLSRALSLGLKPVVVLNKVDRADALSKVESGETESQVLDLFDALGASDEQMEYLTLYASARNGWVTEDVDVAMKLATDENASKDNVKMNVLLDAILEHIPEPAVHAHDDVPSNESNDAAAYQHDKFSLAATTVGYDTYLGRTCTGRIYSGTISLNDNIAVMKRDATELPDTLPTGTVTGLFVNRGISRTPLEPAVASAGDIVTLAGVPDSIAVGDTVTGAANPVPTPVETPPLAPPTLSMDFGANTGPFVGQEGTIVTSSRIRERLMSETDNNVTISVVKSETDSEKTIVYGRGELQLGILVEQMRREGYEFIISPPRIVTKTCPDTGKKMEPFEEVIVDVDGEYSGTVVNALTGARKGVLLEMTENSSDGKTRLIFEVPSRGLLGFGPEIATLTRGTAVVNHCFLEDREFAGNLGVGLENSKLVSSDQGKATAYALASLADRGTLFIDPGDLVYAGMVIGENAKSGDMDVNPVRAKQASNIRTVNKDEKVYLPPAKRMNVEELIGYMNDDEIIEVTPKSVRLRKAELDSGARQRAARSKKKQQDALKQKKK